MRKISDTIARLAALHGRQATARDDFGRSSRLRPFDGFGSNPGALKAQCYLPETLGKGAPLVVVLHGCTQTASGYDHHAGWSQLADEAGFALLYPEQQRSNNPNLCFSWFQPVDSRRGSGEAYSIYQMIDKMVETHDLDRGRVFITGLSAGGAMAAVMLACYPETFAGGAIIAGLPYGSATTIPEAFDRMRGHGGPSKSDLQRSLRAASDHRGPWPKISIWHGTADHTVASANAGAVAGQWRGVHDAENLSAPTTSGRNARRVWTDDAGEAKIEINMIAGMGHGTPVAEGLGAPGPYMLDVGISSTREISHFWNIAETDQILVESTDNDPAARPASPPFRKSDTNRPRSLPQGSASLIRPGSSTASEPPSVKKTIEDALRAAGLMH